MAQREDRVSAGPRSGDRSEARRAWHVARGTWHVARGTWHMARGTWHVARGTWHVARRTSHVARGTSSRPRKEPPLCSGVGHLDREGVSRTGWPGVALFQCGDVEGDAAEILEQDL